jgi:hypothetical protein
MLTKTHQRPTKPSALIFLLFHTLSSYTCELYHNCLKVGEIGTASKYRLPVTIYLFTCMCQIKFVDRYS